jgi:hypothetical protein
LNCNTVFDGKLYAIPNNGKKSNQSKKMQLELMVRGMQFYNYCVKKRIVLLSNIREYYGENK